MNRLPLSLWFHSVCWPQRKRNRDLPLFQAIALDRAGSNWLNRQEIAKQAVEKLNISHELCQGTALEAAEKPLILLLITLRRVFLRPFRRRIAG
jgi:hypothetical protein